MLLDARADPNQVNQYGENALMRASMNGHVEVVQSLLDAGGDPSYTDHQGTDAVEWASINGNVDVWRMLCSHHNKCGKLNVPEKLSFLLALFMYMLWFVCSFICNSISGKNLTKILSC